jgi:hypothetical protein
MGYIKTGLSERGWEVVDWIQLAQDRKRWLALVNIVINIWAVPWFRQVTGFSWRRPGFAIRSVHGRFAVDKVARGQVSLPVLRFFPVRIIPPWLSILVYHLEDEQ